MKFLRSVCARSMAAIKEALTEHHPQLRSNFFILHNGFFSVGKTGLLPTGRVVDEMTMQLMILVRSFSGRGQQDPGRDPGMLDQHLVVMGSFVSHGEYIHPVFDQSPPRTPLQLVFILPDLLQLGLHYLLLLVVTANVILLLSCQHCKVPSKLALKDAVAGPHLQKLASLGLLSPVVLIIHDVWRMLTWGTLKTGRLSSKPLSVFWNGLVSHVTKL